MIVVFAFMNVATEGWVFNQVWQTATGNQESLTSTAVCGAGIYLAHPVVEWNGVFIPVPNLVHIILAGTVTALICMFIYKRGGLIWQYPVMIFAGLIFLLKIIGLLLVYTSGRWCSDLLFNSMEQMVIFTVAGLIFIPFFLLSAFRFLKAVWGLIKK